MMNDSAKPSGKIPATEKRPASKNTKDVQIPASSGTVPEQPISASSGIVPEQPISASSGTSPESAGRSSIHYGWFIAAVCTLSVIGVTLLSTGMSVNLNALRSTMGFSGTQTSMIMTVFNATAFAVTFFADRYFEKTGLRTGMTLAALSGAAAFLIYSLAGPEIYVYYAGALFGGIAYALGFMIPSSILVRRWFNKSRAFALSICSAGTGIAVAVCSPVLQAIIRNRGLQISFTTEAFYMILVAVLIYLIVRNDPSDRNTTPYGGNAQTGTDASSGNKKAQGTGSSPGKSITGSSPGKSITGSSFQKAAAPGAGLLAAVFLMAVISGMGGSPATSHLALNFNSVGIDSMKVAVGLSAYGIILIGSKLFFGRTADRFGVCTATVIFGLILSAGLSGCFAAELFPTDAMMFLSFALLGIGYPIVTLGYPNWASDFSSPEDYPSVLKKFQLGYQLGTLAGSPIPGIIADHAGGYTRAYLVFAVLFFLEVIVIFLAYRQLDRKRRQTADAA